MRQLADLAIWVGMIVLAVGVVYYTPLVAEYVTAEPKPTIVASPGPGSRMHHTMFRPGHSLEEARFRQ